MTDGAFKVAGIDHVEIFVPDRYEAAEWYRQVFGLEILPAFETWAREDGPLMISSDGGATKLALCTGKPLGRHEPVGLRLVAFRVDAAGFAQFLGRLKELAVFNEQGTQVAASDVRDHRLAFSIYFCDPYANRFEVTTYEYDATKALLGQ